MKDFNPRDWYWIVAGDETRAFSSAARAYVNANNATFTAWKADGTLPTRIASEAELWDHLARNVPQIAELIPSALDVLKDRVLDQMNGNVAGLLFKALYNIDSRLRVLESRPSITQAQFRNGLKAL